MQYGKIGNIVLFREDDLNETTSTVWTLQQLHDDPNDDQNPLHPGVVQHGYNVWSCGTNIYIGYGKLAERVLAGEPQPALLPSHTDPIQQVRNLLTSGTVSSGVVNVCLEPDQPYSTVHAGDPVGRRYYDFVRDPMQDGSMKGATVLAALAKALEDERVQTDFGDNLTIVIRYAAEMNEVDTAGDSYAGDPIGFLATAPMVRTAIQEAKVRIHMSFCPGFNPATPDLESVLAYWGDNGSQIFDVVSCTCYVRPQAAGADPEPVFDASNALVQQYYKHFTDTGDPFVYAVDELGGFDQLSSGNDGMLKRMLGAPDDSGALVGGLQGATVPRFQYVTLFLSTGPTTFWGVDATLRFLSP